MSSNRRFLAGLVACLFLVAGCGDKKDKAGSTAATGAGAAAAAGGAEPEPLVAAAGRD